MVKMTELKTKVMSATSLDLAAAGVENITDELIAEKDMKIIGAAFHYTNNDGQDAKVAVTRSGVYSEPGSYNPTEKMDTEKGVLFADRMSSPGAVGEFASRLSVWHMIPSGSWFFLEKGERIYAHVEHHNTAAGPLSFTTDIIIYYY